MLGIKGNIGFVLLCLVLCANVQRALGVDYGKLKSDADTETAKRDMGEILKAEPRVRIPILIEAFDHVRIESPRKTMQVITKEMAQTPKKHVLRAHLTRTNHFYVDGYHIEVAPSSLDMLREIVSLKVSIAKVLAKDSDVEEQLSVLTLTGSLRREAELVYGFVGSSQTTAKDELGQRIMVATIGSFEKKGRPFLSEAPR